jgi:hypothetical protein
MTVSERIEALLDDLEHLQIGKTPRDGVPTDAATPKYFTRADQMVECGSTGNYVTINHQTVGQGIVDCVEQLAKQVEASKAFKVKGKSQILTPGGRRE